MTKILLVEDDKSLREIYGVRLLAEGYDIVSAGDGEEALAMAIKERPALIVSDVMMPKISGFDMLDILRSTTETRDIKVIMMTALSSDDQRQRGEKLGADRYLVKSQVGIEDVVRTVHEVLGDLPGMSPVVQQTPAQQPQPAAQPQQPPQPVQQPVPPQHPTAQQTAPVRPAVLPQPTAPFSSSTPRPAALGDRVIQPIQPPQDQQIDLEERMRQELSGETATPTPQPSPQPAPAQPTPETSELPPVVTEPQPQPQESQTQPQQNHSAMPQFPPQQQAQTQPTPAPHQVESDIERPDIASLSPQTQPQAEPNPPQFQQPQPQEPQASSEPQEEATSTPPSTPQLGD